MKSKRVLVVSKKQSEIVSSWIVISGVCMMIGALIIPSIAIYFSKQAIFKGYYEQFAFQFIIIELLICLLGFIVNEIIYCYKAKIYKVSVFWFCTLVFIGLWNIYYIPRSSVYRYYKDLSYVKENAYCEDVQDLKKANVEYKMEGKSGIVERMYVETTDFRFCVDEYIVRKEDYGKFTKKFFKVKRVKIIYLPNSNTLLAIEPADDDNPKK
ncbi:MAG: hypothetical protein AB6733_09475 [Clostridiaceae bacterium]